MLPTGGSGLAIVDGFTRECLALIADTSLPGLREVREFDFLIAVRGYPAMCVSDNGTEFTSMAILRGFAGSASPTVDWIARQITEAFPWNEAPHYLIRDRDQVYGVAATRRLRAMGIRDKPIAPGSPWQNARSGGVSSVLAYSRIVSFRCSSMEWRARKNNGIAR